MPRAIYLHLSWHRESDAVGHRNSEALATSSVRRPFHCCVDLDRNPDGFDSQYLLGTVVDQIHGASLDDRRRDWGCRLQRHWRMGSRACVGLGTRSRQVSVGAPCLVGGCSALGVRRTGIMAAGHAIHRLHCGVATDLPARRDPRRRCDHLSRSSRRCDGL